MRIRRRRGRPPEGAVDWRRRVFSWATAPLGAIALDLACGDPSHVFEGRRFLEDRGCLEPKTGVDVVSGERPGACAPICLAQPFPDGGRALWLATMCPPYPFPYDASGGDPLCGPGLSALERNDTCFSAGGSTNPLPSDAGAD